MHDDGHFDERVAAHYDDPAAPEFDPVLLARTAEVLAEHAGDGPALEFAIGTGRVALPLLERGVEVHGIELSRAMVARLRAKPGGETVPVTIGDMATTRVAGTFTLVYLVFNTVMNLTSQQAQVAAFANAARHLVPGGRFLVETSVPQLHRLPAGGNVVPFHVSDTRLGFDEYDVVNQGMVSHHVRWDRDVPVRAAVPFRYVWPAELDLMAQLAGMRLVERWADWEGAPFAADSESHVSVWERSA